MEPSTVFWDGGDVASRWNPARFVVDDAAHGAKSGT